MGGGSCDEEKLVREAKHLANLEYYMDIAGEVDGRR